jgi:hypothetical protein
MQRKPDGALRKLKNERFAKPRSVKLRAAICSVVTLFIFVAFSGCAGYQLGPTNGVPAGSRSVQVNLFRNDTWEPRLSEPIATSLRRWIQRDGTYRLATQGDADIVVDGIIAEFNRSGISFQPSDILTVRDYELSAVANFTATERATGKVLVQSTVLGRTTVRAGPDLASAERQAAPLIAEDIARRITSLIVDGTW